MKERQVVLWALVAVFLCGIVWLIFLNGGRHKGGSESARPQEVEFSPPAPTGGDRPNVSQSQPASSSFRAMGLTGSIGTTGTRSLPPQGAAQRGSPRKRLWDSGFFAGLQSAVQGAPIRFDLVEGQWATGSIQHLEHRNGEVTYVSGQLTEPEAGKFFFQKQTQPGKAGAFVGVVEFPGRKLAYRIEPTGPGGAAELVERHLGEVLCLKLPLPTATGTNEVEQIPPLYPDDFPTVPIPPYQAGIVVLESLHGVIPVLYLDFQAGYTTTWGGIAYDSYNFSNSKIRDIWRRVAEDYLPFNINVTTDLHVYQNAPEGSRQRVICTPTTTAAPGAGGVAYIGSWNWTGDTPCWVFNSGNKSCAEACSHEAGHTLGLSHDGADVGGVHTEYYAGQGSGVTGWAPIMGVGYYQNVAQWSKGEYLNANNTQDDLNIITAQNNNVDYRADDTGATLATSRYLELYPDYSASAQGVIERTADTDAFQFTTTGGTVSLQANPLPGDWADLAIMATLGDSTDTIIASNNPQSVLYASITTNLPAGTYTFRVTAAGRNDPLTDGFSAYASLGYYSITGTVANARLPSRFAIPENTPNGTLVGVVSANNPGGNPLIYTITSGNTGNTFALNSAGNLTVANNALLNYETLAANVQLPVQFEMFVNITNTVTPALTELNRRLVVAVTNVNEAPTLSSGFSISLLEHSLPGTVIGTMTASDPDLYTLLSYSLGGGNSNGMFSIDSNTGVISVAGDLNAAVQSLYNLSVVVSDQTPPTPLTATSTVTVAVLANNSPFRPGAINYAVYTNITGYLVSDLTSAASYPRDPAFEKPVALFEGDSNRGDNYGAVMRGYVIAPATGSYRFWIATDDNGELWLSPSTNPASMSLIASITGSGNWASPRLWTKYSSQRSGLQSLVAGQAYYIEGRLKEASGSDNIAVAWTGPGLSGTNVIPGYYLAPYFMNYVPHGLGFTYNLHRDAIVGTPLGVVGVRDVNTEDGHSFVIAGGNTGGVFTVDPGSGMISVANDSALQTNSQSSYTLVVNVTDNGAPPLSNTTTVVVNVVSTNAITATSPQQELWNNLSSGTAVSDLTNNARFPKQPDTLLSLSGLDGGQNLGDNYGSRIRAYLTPVSTGVYTFYLASDDNSQLLLSPGTNPASASVIASVGGWTDYQVWSKYASQQSAPVSLTAGQRYYVEVLHKEAGGGDHVEVAWTGPGLSGTNIIAGSFLTPVDINYPPDISDQTVYLLATATNGGLVTTLTAVDSPLDALTYKIISGNSNNAFAIEPDSGRITVADSSWVAGHQGAVVGLVVQAQDSGCGGLYPLKSAQARATVYVVNTAGPLVWTGGSGTTDYWGDTNNWDVLKAPTLANSVIFTNLGSTNLPGAVNNVVSSTLSVAGLSDVATVSYVSLVTNYHTTYLNPGVTLTVAADTNANGSLLFLGGADAVNDSQYYYTIQGGAGASLLMGNVSSPGTNHALQVSATGPSTIGLNHVAQLDLSGLDNFTFAGGIFWVGHNATTSGGANDRAAGRVYLARTNLIIANDTIAFRSDGAFRLNDQKSNQPGLESVVELGQDNTIYTDFMKIGGQKSGASAGGRMFFRSGLTNPRLKLRAADGVSRMPQLFVGNHYEVTSGTTGSKGTLDLTGGTADILVTTMYVARTGNGTANVGPANGTVTLMAGTLDVTTLNVGYQQANSGTSSGTTSIATGVVNVLSNATLVANTITLGHDAGSAAGTGVATLNVDGGTVTVTNTLAESNASGGNASSTINLTNNGVLTIGGAVTVDTLNFGGGTLKYASANAADISSSITTVAVNGGGATIDTGTNNVTFASAIGNSGAGRLTKAGSGRLILSVANPYAGGTTVTNGTLRVSNGSGSATGSGGVVVAAGATLEGTGSISGAVTVKGRLSPGASIGTLAINNSLTFSPGSTAWIEVDLNTLAHDSVIGLSTVTYGGTLVVTNLGGAGAATNGASLQLFSAGSYSSNSFATANLPALGPGLLWDTSGLTNNGTLKIVSSVSTVPTNITTQVNGSTLDLSWPPDHVGWRLEGQTNAVNVGLTTNWFTVPGSAETNRVIVVVNPAWGSVFYRLVYP